MHIHNQLSASEERVLMSPISRRAGPSLSQCRPGEIIFPRQLPSRREENRREKAMVLAENNLK